MTLRLFKRAHDVPLKVQPISAVEKCDIVGVVRLKLKIAKFDQVGPTKGYEIRAAILVVIKVPLKCIDVAARITNGSDRVRDVLNVLIEHDIVRKCDAVSILFRLCQEVPQADDEIDERGLLKEIGSLLWAKDTAGEQFRNPLKVRLAILTVEYVHMTPNGETQVRRARLGERGYPGMPSICRGDACQ